MIGNDIIDLKLTAKQSNWKRPRFLNKLFTEKEQHYIRESSNPFETVWLFWSMKESAYKIYMQHGGIRTFAPLKFESTIESSTKGFVSFDTFICKTCSTINSNFIHTVATFEKDSADIHIYPFENFPVKAQRNEIYRLLKINIAQKKDLDFKYLEIRKTTAGVPKIYFKSLPLDVSFSLSYHGGYGAVVVL